MVLKRPFGDEELCSEHPWKQPRQLECGNQLPSFVETVSRNDVTQRTHYPASEIQGDLNKCQDGDTLVSENVGIDKDFETAPSSNTCVTSIPSQEGSKFEAAVCFSFFPGLFDPDHLIRPRAENQDISSLVFDFLPRRLVSIGPDHQADVPVWGAHSINNDVGSSVATVPSDSSCEFLGSSQKIDDDNSEKMLGTCVIPMPDFEAALFDRDKVGSGRIDCSCQDEGSMRCVRQHIVEAREKLIVTLGQETFLGLGFGNMGEEVATNWSEEEEQVFHEVVFSNPTSLGKNFWDHLWVVFPSRTKKEIVSYYFNVFMLRKRGEQNRLDPINVDSDNDEWQGIDDGDEELGAAEEDEDSVVESPANDDYPVHRTLVLKSLKDPIHENYMVESPDDDVFFPHREQYESGDDESCDYNMGDDGVAARDDGNGNLDYFLEACNVHRKYMVESPENDGFCPRKHNLSGEDESCDNNVGNDGVACRRADDTGKLDYFSEPCNGKSPADSSSGPAHQKNSEEDHDLQDNSCTSYECQVSRGGSSFPTVAAAKQECRVESDHGKQFQNSYDGLTSMSNLGYDLETCDAKVWDVGFLSSCKADVDLLPTCNMIEEVFGD
ncbi:At-rich interactive domain-containing protein [Thalictrum thalictroides]|uniref:At-rich interactive domain-containing protein n=1 Tax=Thalictrum thalictroides TaxID=46969 RepID=A0A7J6WC81_THATH|nr:At-rich interactive domain-containing protein [Thalictrum thalictroides]